MRAIQPCALLLLVGPDWQVETASANLAMLGEQRPAETLGQPLADLIGSKAIHTLRNRLSWLASDESEVQDFGVQWGDVVLDIRATRNEEDQYLIEAELAVEQRLPDGIGMVRSMTDRLTGDEPHELALQAMRQLAALTGFEQVQLADSSGRSLAGIPAAADELALASSSGPRVIADRDCEAITLIGEMDSPLLNRAAFRAPDPDELERLNRLSAVAAMTFPLKIDGQQVATLYASHGSARRIGAERRSVAHLFAERLVARMARQGGRF